MFVFFYSSPSGLSVGYSEVYLAILRLSERLARRCVELFFWIVLGTLSPFCWVSVNSRLADTSL